MVLKFHGGRGHLEKNVIKRLGVGGGILKSQETWLQSRKSMFDSLSVLSNSLGPHGL